jgi:hypothetical protein
VSASHKSAAVTDRRSIANVILGYAPKSSHSNSYSAFLGDLCAFAVKKSSIPNFASVQHMLQNLSRHRTAAIDLVPNGSRHSNSSGEGYIRRALIEADLVETAPRECVPLIPEGSPQVASGAKDNMIALPGQLFSNTQILACIWLLTKNKSVCSRAVPSREGQLMERYKSIARNKKT